MDTPSEAWRTVSTAHFGADGRLVACHLRSSWGSQLGRLSALPFLVGALSGCPEPPTAPVSRAEVLGPFLADYWRLPIPHQGEPPEGFSPAEASLDPAACGACHPKQYAEWKVSFHAGAYSPGFAGQLIEGGLAKPGPLRKCQTCHTPLAEQQPVTAAGKPEASFDEGLRGQGIVCASCHVRGHRRRGPPPRPEAAQTPGAPPHGGFEVRSEFQEARFCAPCHQFFDDPGVAGKPVENTWVEWRQSPYAAEGRTCQSCHMPDRAHLWRGIHDADMVRSGIEVKLIPLDLADDLLTASLWLRNSGVGHAFPTYVTPRVFLAVWQEDAKGEELPDTRVETAIGREIDFGAQPRTERFDTRVLPGKSVQLAYEVPRAGGAASLVGRVTVDPDWHYRGVFNGLRQRYKDERAREWMEEAYRRTSESIYVLNEIRRKLPDAGS